MHAFNKEHVNKTNNPLCMLFCVLKLLYNITFQANVIHFPAPDKKSLPDFWRMIWKEECGHIIMLTNLVEASKVYSLLHVLLFLFVVIFVLIMIK